MAEVVDYFVYDWGDGYQTRIELPEEKGAGGCNHGNPSLAMGNFSTLILADASHGTEETTGLNKVEDYLVNAMPVLQAYYNVAVDIKEYWDRKEIECASWQNGCCPANWYCYKHAKFCYKSENTLEGYYWDWHYVPTGIAEDLLSLQEQLAQVSHQIEVNAHQQQVQANLAYTEAMINKLIAETNQVISIVAFENESREIALAKKKTVDIFTPAIIILVLVGLGVYLYKPKSKTK